jgi:hypothetical protein
MRQFEWAIVGSGIAGIITSEILTREGHSAILIEKNETLASETTREFHEWMHAGSLYTLIPDNLKTLKFILGAVDDLLDFYSSYERMNLIPTMKGLDIGGNDDSWFIRDNYMHFKFRISGRKITFPWLIGVARSMLLIERIREHDWLRRRAGVLDPFKYSFRELSSTVVQLMRSKEKFAKVKTPDFTMNSRAMIKDMIATSIEKGLEISKANKFNGYEKSGTGYLLKCEKESFIAKNIALCNGENAADFTKARVKKSYAPLAVVGNVNQNTESFVELDYYPKNCINILKKEHGIGLVGGISFNNKGDCDEYIEKVIKKHQEYNPEIKKLHKYIGTKSEIIIDGEPRNYLYHIIEIEQGVWIVIPGKFTLGFSIGPEFYRRVFGKNPGKYFPTTTDTGKYDNLVSNTVWQDVLRDGINNNNPEDPYGND